MSLSACLARESGIYSVSLSVCLARESVVVEWWGCFDVHSASLPSLHLCVSVSVLSGHLDLYVSLLFVSCLSYFLLFMTITCISFPLKLVTWCARMLIHTHT